MKREYLILLILLVIIAGAGWYYVYTQRQPAQIGSGQTGTSRYVYSNTSADAIRVDTPGAGAVVGKSFSVIGQAQGSWFFEASFPVQVIDQDGNIIASAPATTTADWMTTDLIPFRADLTVPESYIGPATIVLKKDNPSGMPENDASLSYPITVEY